MSITRGPIPADGYTIISNAWLRDPEISWKAKGLLAYIASHEPGYRLGTDQIIAEGRDSRDAVRSGLRELEEAGYLRRVEARDGAGQMLGVDFELTDPERKPVAGKPVAGHDQAKQGVSAGQSSDGKSGHGLLSSKKTTKKTSSEEGATAPPQPDGSKPENAGDVVAAFVDYCSGRSVTLPKQVVGRYAREIKSLLDQGFTSKLIKLALSRMLDRDKHTHPALLSTFLVEVQGSPRPVSAPPAPARQGFKTAAEKAEDERRRQSAIAKIADQIAEQWKTDPTDYIMNRKVTEKATQVYEEQLRQVGTDQSTTCSATGYSASNAGGIIDAEWTEHSVRREVTAGES